VNETVDEEGEEDLLWDLKVDADTALEPPDEPPSRGASEGGVVTFGEVSFGGADSELRIEEGQTTASDPFAEMPPAPRTLKDLVESDPFTAAGKKRGGSDDGDTLSQTHSHSMVVCFPVPGPESSLGESCPSLLRLAISNSLRRGHPLLHIPLEFGS